MINKFKNYADEAVDFAEPYVEAAGRNAAKAAKFVKKNLAKNARRKVKAAKRYRFITKLKKVLELASSVILLAASVVALVSIIKLKFDNNDTGE